MSAFARPGHPRWSQADEPWALFPKVTLHDHLDGSLRPETLIELADQAGVALPYDDPEGLTMFELEAEAGEAAAESAA